MIPPFSNVSLAVESIKTSYPVTAKILVETGITAAISLLKPQLLVSPLDAIILSVYKGELDAQFIGLPHPTIEEIKETFTLEFTS